MEMKGAGICMRFSNRSEAKKDRSGILPQNNLSCDSIRELNRKKLPTCRGRRSRLSTIAERRLIRIWNVSRLSGAERGLVNQRGKGRDSDEQAEAGNPPGH